MTQATATVGKTNVGATSDVFLAERKRVNRYALPTSGSVTKLSICIAPTSTSGQQVLKGIIYADSSGTPGALLTVSEDRGTGPRSVSSPASLRRSGSR